MVPSSAPSAFSAARLSANRRRLQRNPHFTAIRDGWQEIVDATDKINCPFVLTGMMPHDMHGVKEIADTIFSSE